MKDHAGLQLVNELLSARPGSSVQAFEPSPKELSLARAIASSMSAARATAWPPAEHLLVVDGASPW